MAPSASVVKAVNEALVTGGCAGVDPGFLAAQITEWRQASRDRVPAGSPPGALSPAIAGNIVLPVAQDVGRMRAASQTPAAFERMLFEILVLVFARTTVAARVGPHLSDAAFRTWLLSSVVSGELVAPPAPAPLAPPPALAGMPPPPLLSGGGEVSVLDDGESETDPEASEGTESEGDDADEPSDEEVHAALSAGAAADSIVEPDGPPAADAYDDPTASEVSADPDEPVVGSWRDITWVTLMEQVDLLIADPWTIMIETVAALFAQWYGPFGSSLVAGSLAAYGVWRRAARRGVMAAIALVSASTAAVSAVRPWV